MSKRDPKELILDAALAAFVEHGFDRATTAHIQGRAGISNGALFHHFASKDAIAESLYLRGLTSYQQGLLRTLEQRRGPKAARAAVQAAVHHHLAWVESNRDLAWFMYERGRPDWQAAHGNAVRALNRTTARQVHDWMTPLVEAGVIRDLPLTVLAALINGPAHFIARRWLSGLNSARPTSFSDMLADAAWAAVAPHKPKAPTPPARMSPAARLEAAVLAAARGLRPDSAAGDWTILQLTMNAPSAASHRAADGVSVSAARLDCEDRIALIELALLDDAGNAAIRGSAVCAHRANQSEHQSVGDRA